MKLIFLKSSARTSWYGMASTKGITTPYPAKYAIGDPRFRIMKLKTNAATATQITDCITKSCSIRWATKEIKISSFSNSSTLSSDCFLYHLANRLKVAMAVGLPETTETRTIKWEQESRKIDSYQEN